MRVRKFLTLLMILGMFGTFSAVSGCHTVAGAGKDIQSGGEKLHDEAQEQQKKM
jgi:predicted small secreted protein